MQRSTVTLNLLIFLLSGTLLGALSPFYIRLFGIYFTSNFQFWLFCLISSAIGLGLGSLMFAINKLTLIRPLRVITLDLKNMLGEEALQNNQNHRRDGQDELRNLSYWFHAFVQNLEKKLGSSRKSASVLREHGVELNIKLRHSADIMRTVSHNLGSIEKLSKDQGNLAYDTRERVQDFTRNYSKITQDFGVLSDNFKDFSYYVQKQGALAQDFFNSIESLKHSLGDQNSGKVKDQLNSDLFGITTQFTKESTRSIDEQIQRFTRIEKLLEEIEDIAESTHLLSINASIEAARAGDSGRGFTIVALQIRNLATNSGALTSEIRDQIETIISMAKNSGARLGDLRGILNGRMDDVITDMQSLNSCATDIAKTIEQISSIEQKLKNNVEDIDEEFGASNEIRGTLLRSIGFLSDYSEKLNQSVERMMARSGQIEQVTQDFLSQGAKVEMVERQTAELLESVNHYQKDDALYDVVPEDSEEYLEGAELQKKLPEEREVQTGVSEFEAIKDGIEKDAFGLEKE